MNVRKWVWCLHCERCFEVYLSREPQLDTEGNPPGLEWTMQFAPDFELQLGVETNGTVYAECPYEDCDGGMLDFWWWEDRRGSESDGESPWPEVPEEDKVYPLYPVEA